MAHKDFRPLFRALKEQAWTCEETSGGHFKLYPPDKSKEMVRMATTSHCYRAIKNVIRDLKASGFIWPWPPEAQKEKETDDMRLNLDDLFAEPAPEAPADTAVAAPVVVDDVDALFRALKDARNYAALAKDARDEAAANAAAAQTALQGSEKEYELALASLRSAKAAFDAEFGK